MYREKKIAEIREGYKSERDDNFTYKKEIVEQDIRFLLSELERLKREYAEERAAHNAHVTELCELGKENRKLREERDEARSKAEEAWKEIDSLEEQLLSSQQEIEQLREERNKLIEALRWYGDRETYDGNVEWDDDGNIIRAEWPPINVDNGQRARNILREVGVTVEW